MPWERGGKLTVGRSLREEGGLVETPKRPDVGELGKNKSHSRIHGTDHHRCKRKNTEFSIKEDGTVKQGVRCGVNIPVERSHLRRSEVVFLHEKE